MTDKTELDAMKNETKEISFIEFCLKHDATDNEKFELAHHLAGMRYKRTILCTLGANVKPAKSAMAGML